ncbi:MAG: DNA-binding response regulator [Pseudomonadales bacterium]|jgi:DNA-binding NarL/FixJ family response regulator|uniref:response regulator n=1 Tax=Halopseudomonas TaxID=2901189 RepID=UPI000C60C7C5|nr:response regulator transcription factor [Halopseudomonas aestusnigri]MAG99975.1 DNA-binding response regulator [Pseudomonadales bacterium]MEE2798250.1 response regulator transcription factor [Pseudomonadota bacterium]HBT59033.1 DNA-binding response regulator [Pseudomonas sp.]MAK74369.1 DNA-binding response regulator [Pseudomonadales bacterium]MAP76361.1 DNA-binding response regulator [Pseudomonadales bacterium]|tara:strand:- start:267 stop:905 length:639 start_codon:yes stop_codon:yes gene_type:complete
MSSLPPDTRLLLIDDHQIYLDGLSLTLGSLCEGVKLDHARNAAEALQLVREYPYDLILLDLQLPDSSGLSLMQKLRAADAMVPIAILSASNSPSDLEAALQLGAAGFISKTTDGKTLLDAVTQLLYGAQVVIGDTALKIDRQTSAREVGITPRQLEILDLLAEGLPNKVICQRLSLSEDTVKTHLKALFSSLDCHNRTECVTQARKLGLVSF